MRKVILFSVIGLAALTVIWYFWIRKEGAYEWTTGNADHGDITISISSTGTINPVSTVLVGTQVSGKITKIYVDFNSNVKAGQIIAELDKTFLNAALEDAKANEERARVQLNQLKREYDRAKKLYEEKVIAEVDYITAMANYETAEANLRSAVSTTSRALINLKYAVIYAPIDGIVVSRAVDVGQTVAASFNTPTLFQIANDLTKMEVIASVDEADIGQIKTGQEAEFTVDAFPDQTFKGTVKQIRIQPVIAQNVVTYNVVVEVSNPEKKLLPGMTANINFIIQRKENVLRVPASALRFTPDEEVLKEFGKHVPDSIKKKILDKQNGKKKEWKAGSNKKNFQGKGKRGTVWVKVEDEIKPVRVKTGLSDGSFTEIEGEITEKDVLALSVKKPEKDKSSQTQQQNPFSGGQQRGMRRGM